MNMNDRKAIEELFEKLATVERQSPERDAEAEAFIRRQIADQPGAPYYMAQTIVVQEQALEAMNKRLAELNGSPNRAPTRSDGSVPRVHRPGAEIAGGTRGGGFLASATQTALGVAGGLLLGNAIAGMFGSGEADTAQAAEAEKDDPQLDDADYDGGFDGGDFGDLDI